MNTIYIRRKRVRKAAIQKRAIELIRAREAVAIDNRYIWNIQAEAAYYLELIDRYKYLRR